ncbi:hypothetical protein F2Q70_00003029 [Brassica cretica]|uniref:Uncharacterized protein n=1 Tax=Brassica cretica TaxID=69181 RepID=A0A3N6QHH6_BRACR|nr:hypothetical protein F2Q70_00003029 [Brassica cretica]KAF3561326.1 hypothetical protein DY000_02014709 [Brassica cretica]
MAWFELGRGETTWTRDLVVEHSVGEDLEHDWLTTRTELGCSGVDRRRGLTQRVGCDRGNMAETRAWEGADADHRRGLSLTADSWQRAPGRTVGRRHGGETTWTRDLVVEHSVGEDLEHDWLTTRAELGCGGEERRRGLTQRAGCDRGNMAETRAWEGADADHRRGLSLTADSWQRAPGRTAGRRRG